MKTILSNLIFACVLCAQTQITFDSTPDFLKWPEHIHMGEPAGVARDSHGNVFVYTRTGTADVVPGASRTFINGGSRLFEFDATGKYVREIGEGLYGFVFAETVKVDPQDNIWVVDRGSSLVIKFTPDGRVSMVLGRKPEAISETPLSGLLAPAEPTPGRGAAPAGGGRGRGPAPGAGAAGDSFVRPADIAWDSSGNIFVADGYGNSRIAKFDKDGVFISSWGQRGSEPGQFNVPHSIAIDSQNNVYVADLGNKRIQVFDNAGKFKTQYTNGGAPWAVCISPGPHQYIFSSYSNDPSTLDNGQIYKMELTGEIVGQFGRAGKLPKEFGTVNEIDCRDANQLIVGEVMNWRIQKVTLRSSGR